MSIGNEYLQERIDLSWYLLITLKPHAYCDDHTCRTSPLRSISETVNWSSAYSRRSDRKVKKTNPWSTKDPVVPQWFVVVLLPSQVFLIQLNISAVQLNSIDVTQTAETNPIFKTNISYYLIRLLDLNIFVCSAKYIHAYHAIPLDNTIQCEQFSRKRSLAECAGNLFNLTLAILSIFKSREAVIDRLRGLIKRVLQRIKV